MNTPKLIICQGLPGSGKTTWAREQLLNGVMRVNRDDIRAMAFTRFTEGNEKITRKLRDLAIQQGLMKNMTVISDDTNLIPSTFEGLKKLAHDASATVEIKSFLDVPLRACIERDEKRQNPVGASVIRDMWTKWIRPTLPHQDPTKPKAIICDLDGTAALLNGRNPYDASTCFEDLVNPAVAKILRSYEGRVLFVSGRQKKDNSETIRWITTKLQPKWLQWDLFMRETGDTRDDAIVKEEIFHNFIEPNYFVEFVLDDRDKVVDMWRGMGLTTLQVGYGSF